MNTIPTSINLQLSPDKKAYFASDFHLGADYSGKSIERERIINQWLSSIRKDTGALFLVGDLFDFWFEYKYVVPKGFTRFLAELSKFTEDKIPVYVFTGNHDIWMFDYLEKELGVKILRQPYIFNINKQKFYIGHGDGLGPGDSKFKFLKKIFTFPFFQTLFSWIHPDIGVALAQTWSNHSRTDPKNEIFMGEDKERLVIFVKEQIHINPADYYIFGHRHLPLNIEIDHQSRYINLGDWMYNFTYLEYDGIQVELKKYYP
ncbi:MAG: UDP-2,3-diacylglucosamine diphosphatase [Chitinophagales bacterium]|nr:UDP-2,3-diacylglucosamine diphosphatase [Chitinophagales bacterium]